MVSIVEQARCLYACEAPPDASMGVVGTRLTSQDQSETLNIRSQVIGTDAITGKPVYSAPASAALVGEGVPTISEQSGDNPAPIPPVGTISPQAGRCVAPLDAAPKKSSWGGVALFAGAIILLWIFAGVSLRRFL